MERKLRQTSSDHPAGTPEGLNFAELLKLIRFRRKLLYVFTALALFGALFRQVFYVPLYSAQTRLSIEKFENDPMQLALANLGATQVDTSDRLKRYIDYLQSSEFLLAFAETLKFKEGYQKLNMGLPSDLAITKKKFWQQFLATHFGNQPQGADVAAPEPVLIPVEKLADILGGMLSVEAVGTDTIRIHITALDPSTSMILANTAAEVFVRKTGERDYNEVTEVKKFIEQELDQTTERLKHSEAGLIDFKKRHNIVSSSRDEHNPFTEKLQTIETELEENKLKYQENEKLIEYYQNALQKQEQQVLSNGAASIDRSNSELIDRLRVQMDNLRYKKTLMVAQGYAEDSWQMKEINDDINKTADMLKQQLALSSGKDSSQGEAIPVPEAARAKLTGLKEDNKALEMKISAIERTRTAFLKNIEGMPQDEQLLFTLGRDVDLQFELYSMLKKKLQEVEIQQVALQSHVTVSERAEVPPPVPRTNFIVKILFALLIGFFFGGSAALVMEAADPTIKHPYDMERMELIPLGMIPHVEGSPMRQNLAVGSYRPDLLICKEKPESREAMAFKHVRAQITRQHAADGSPAKLIAITSPARGDGKSFVSANIAVSLAQLEKKTLLIDADLRNPSIPWLFGYREGDGLSSLLTMKSTLNEILVRGRFPYLDILPAGWLPSNPSELISNAKFSVLLEHLKKTYDYVVIDCPPAIAVVDAAILASLSDTVIMTAGFRKTRKDSMIAALRRILQVSHRHVHALLNNVWEIDGESTYTAYGAGSPSSRNPLDSKADLEAFEDVLKKVG